MERKIFTHGKDHPFALLTYEWNRHPRDRMTLSQEGTQCDHHSAPRKVIHSLGKIDYSCGQNTRAMWYSDRDTPDITVVHRYPLYQGRTHSRCRRDHVASRVHEKTIPRMGRKSEMELVYLEAEIFLNPDTGLVLEEDWCHDTSII